MEDGHTLFDYDVRLNDTIQLLVRQSLVLPPSAKERDSELSDTDSGCCLGQSESDKSSTHGEAAADPDDKAGLDDKDAWDETDLGLYKVRLPEAARAQCHNSLFSRGAPEPCIITCPVCPSQALLCPHWAPQPDMVYSWFFTILTST
jgi:hypothetical protein